MLSTARMWTGRLLLADARMIVLTGIPKVTDVRRRHGRVGDLVAASAIRAGRLRRSLRGYGVGERETLPSTPLAACRPRHVDLHSIALEPSRKNREAAVTSTGLRTTKASAANEPFVDDDDLARREVGEAVGRGGGPAAGAQPGVGSCAEVDRPLA